MNRKFADATVFVRGDRQLLAARDREAVVSDWSCRNGEDWLFTMTTFPATKQHEEISTARLSSNSRDIRNHRSRNNDPRCAADTKWIGHCGCNGCEARARLSKHATRLEKRGDDDAQRRP
jgi:hypothetical protein